jgi:hypothetical protein
VFGGTLPNCRGARDLWKIVGDIDFEYLDGGGDTVINVASFAT